MTLFLSPHNDDETLFGAYTLMREDINVIICIDAPMRAPMWGLRGARITVEQRRVETQRAMAVLGREVAFLGIHSSELNATTLREALKPWAAARDLVVYAPAKEGGHRHHDLVASVAQELFKNIVQYCTYGKGERRSRNGVEVIATEEEKQRKRLALQCYVSQIHNPHTAAFFTTDNREYIKEKPMRSTHSI